jgi:hypothetical protein
MNRTRALIVSLAVAIAAIAGVFALGDTLTLGANAQSPSNGQVTQRAAQLDRYEASLRKALAQKSPPLPPVPSTTVQQSSTLQSAAPVRVVYHRPPPIVNVKHRAGGEHENENEYEGGGEDD